MRDQFCSSQHVEQKKKKKRNIAGVKCHMCSDKDAETTTTRWDTLTHAKGSATAPDSGWRSARRHFMTNEDDKGSWLVHSSRSVKRSGRGALEALIQTAQVSESLVRGLGLGFKQSLLHGNAFLRLELGLGKHFISDLALFGKSSSVSLPRRWFYMTFEMKKSLFCSL